MSLLICRDDPVADREALTAFAGAHQTLTGAAYPRADWLLWPLARGLLGLCPPLGATEGVADVLWSLVRVPVGPADGGTGAWPDPGAEQPGDTAGPTRPAGDPPNTGAPDVDEFLWRLATSGIQWPCAPDGPGEGRDDPWDSDLQDVSEDDEDEEEAGEPSWEPEAPPRPPMPPDPPAPR